MIIFVFLYTFRLDLIRVICLKAYQLLMGYVMLKFDWFLNA